MNVRYKREMRHNYLILEAAEKEEESFEIRMLTGNSIEGLLKFRIKHEERAAYYYYEITSKQPLSRLLEFREIKKEELSTLIVEIGAILKRIEDYLLSESNILLEPEHIYIEPESYQVWLCYVPGYEKSFPQAMEKLLQYLLKKTDHKNNDTVVLAYRLYQESQKDYYGIEDLLRIVRESQQGKLKENLGEWKKKDSISYEEMGKNQKRNGKSERNDGNEWGKEDEWGEKDEWNTENGWDGRWKSEWEEGDERDKKRRYGQENKKDGRLKKENAEKDTLKSTGKVFVGLTGIIFLIPLLMWLYAGMTGLRQYWTALLVLDIAAVSGAAIYLCIYLWKKKRRYFSEKEENSEEKQKEWQMTFAQEDINKEVSEEGMVKVEEKIFRDNMENKEYTEQEAENTVLLAEASPENGQHLLKSVNPSIHDIAIPYFPFIIGKQEGIVDFVLKKETVSRIHLRIDEENGNCKVTDLNSSNGTAVGAYHLEANESYVLCSGDKLSIADISFIFY